MRICSECGLDMDLVGLRHRCVPRVVTKPVTKPLPVTKPNRGGRPRLGEGVMSAAERMRRMRARRRSQ